MKAGMLFSGLAAAVAIVGLTGCAKTIYEQKGEISNKVDGWKYFVAGKKKHSYIPSEGFYLDKGGKLVGPKIPVKDGEYKFFEAKFDAKTSGLSYWAMFYYDKNGKPIVADTYSTVYRSSKLAPMSGVVYGRMDMQYMQLIFQSKTGVEAANLQISEISPCAAAKWCDQLYATLPSLKYQAPQDRMKLLPKTLKAMKSGKPWRVVMLGDSIINDTFNSNFQALLKRNYPKSDLEFICSVRGSTGCWYYQDPVQFKKYVTDLKPDLLIIGGISQRNDIAAIKKVIVQAKKLNCEIMLMTGPMNEDWRPYDKNKPDAPLKKQSWTHKMIPEKRMQPTKLAAVAKEFNIEFLDMKSPWQIYLGASGKPWRWFHRDRVHANDRGKQIIGRILTRYMTK